MAAWNRGRSLRTSRSIRNRHDNGDDRIKIDYAKDPTENAKEILRNIIQKPNNDKVKKLAYLNCLVKFMQHVHIKSDIKLSLDDLLCCLRIVLFDEAQEVRAAGLRAIRYLMQDEAAIDALWKLQLHHLIARSLDILLDNQTERVQALRLMRKIAHLCPTKFPSAFTHCLVSIANDGSQVRDHVLRAALATLSELVVLNPEVLSQCNIVGTLLENILDCQHPRISEALVGTILCLLNHPKTRGCIRPRVDLERIVAPFTDCHYQHSGEEAEFLSDDKEMRFLASKMALLSALRSWPGMIRLCKPGDSALQSLIEVLYLPDEISRKGITDVLFDLFRLSVSEWTDDVSIALLAADSSTMQESWKLFDGFVSEEGKSILAHLTYQRPNLVENYLALLLLAFLNAGILEALVEVIVTSSCKLSIRATILLGELLHIANSKLPHECVHHTHCLPSLIAVAASSEVPPDQRHRASAAVNCLNRLHALKKRGPVPCSLFLDQLVQFSRTAYASKRNNKDENSLLKYLEKETDNENFNQGMKHSQVLLREYSEWNWNLIGALIIMTGDYLRKLEENTTKQFIRRLVQFYKPTSKQFSHISEQTREDARIIVHVGCHLMDFLVLSEQEAKSTTANEAMKILDEFLIDVGLCISQVNVERAPLDLTFSPNKMMSTLSQYYFLFVGRLSHRKKGRMALERTGVIQHLIKLVSITSHDCYLKLVISSLDYSQDGLARIIISKVLTSACESARLYSTQFMRVLIRLRLPDFNKWGMELLVTQVYDKSRAVSLAAMDILDEACNDKVNLEALINLRPSLLHLGDRGQLLLVRFLSLETGFKYLNNANYVTHEMEKWRKTYNLKYVKIVEDELNDALTRHQRGEDGNFQRRSNQKHVVRDVYVPAHLYGQLAQHEEGLKLLIHKEVLVHLVQTVRLQEIETDEQVLHLKAALWALGHIGTSNGGVVLLIEEEIIQEIVKLAEESCVFSIRGTCFNVLGLLALTPVGVRYLSQVGWESVRHHCREQWPIAKEFDIDLNDIQEMRSPLDDPESDDDTVRSWGSSHVSVDKLNGGGKLPSFHVTESEDSSDGRLTSLSDFDGLAVNGGFSRSAGRILQSSVSFDGALSLKPVMTLAEKSFTLPHRKKYENGDVSINPSPPPHPRCLSEPQDPNHRQKKPNHLDLSSSPTGPNLAKAEKNANFSFCIEPKPRLKMTLPTNKRNRSRSFNETSSPVVPTTPNSIGKLRSVSNIEIVHGDFHDNDGKEDRSSSNESSQTSKSRSDSCTDSTSGLGSSESSTTARLGVVSEHAQTLSPIASSTSLNTIGHRIHQSNSMRKLTNWRHTPVVLRRVSSNPTGQLTPDSLTGGESAFGFTLPRDAAGYEVLRTVQRRRIGSNVDEPWHVGGPIGRHTRSLEGGRDTATFRIFTDFISSTPYMLQRQVMSVGSQSPSTAGVRFSTSITDDVKYMGLSLPIDINMIFMVDDQKADCQSNRPSYHSRTSEQSFEMSQSNLSTIIEQSFEVVNPSNPSVRDEQAFDAVKLSEPKTRVSAEEELDLHSVENCLKCSRLVDMNSKEHVEEHGDGQEQPGTVFSPDSGHVLMKTSSSGDASTETTTESISSTLGSSRNQSFGEGFRHWAHNDKSSQVNARKEMMKLLIRLSSSFASKSAEKELLRIKQKMPAFFQDLCLYSEILYLMSQYNFRLTARRFVQELFLDINFQELFEEPTRILECDDLLNLGDVSSEVEA